MALIGRRTVTAEPDADLRAQIAAHANEIVEHARELTVLAATMPDADAVPLREFCTTVLEAEHALRLETKLTESEA